MITVKGVRYFNDYNMPSFEKQFENVGQFEYFIKHDTIGKSRVRFPKANPDGTLPEYSSSFEWADEYRSNDGDVQKWIYLITENDKILYSNGRLTDGKQHASKAIRDLFDHLTTWQKEEYDFAD